MSVKCELCGKEVTSTQGLAGHKRFAHELLDKTKSETPSATQQVPATQQQVQATQQQVLAQQPKNGEALKKEPVLEQKPEQKLSPPSEPPPPPEPTDDAGKAELMAQIDELKRGRKRGNKRRRQSRVKGCV